MVNLHKTIAALKYYVTQIAFLALNIFLSTTLPHEVLATGSLQRDLDRDGIIDLVTPTDGGLLKTQMFFYLDKCSVIKEMTESCELDYQCKAHYIWYYWTGEAYAEYRSSIEDQLKQIDPSTQEGREALLALSTPTSNPQYKRQAIMDIDGVLTAFCENESGNGCMSVEACLARGKENYPEAIEDRFPEVPFSTTPVNFVPQHQDQ